MEIFSYFNYHETMTLQQLKYAVAVADTHNITEASRRLFISQPSLTAAIRDLETEMGIIIFSRSNKGVTITNDGDEFLSYARQILEQTVLLEDRFKNKNGNVNPIFSVSAQHYSFAVNAFIDVIRKFGEKKYNFTLRETQTHEIIEDVAHLKSEIGVLYLSGRNENIISKLIKKNNLSFRPLFTTSLYVFISTKNPLAKKQEIKLVDLEPFPYLSYEQGDFNSFYFAEEPLTEIDFDCHKNIQVRDRATLFNLLIGLNGYTICSGIISHELNGANIISRPLVCDEHMTVGILTRKGMLLSRYATTYIESLKQHVNTPDSMLQENQ